MKRRLLLSIAAGAVMATSAGAADLGGATDYAPAASPFTWTGFYLGAHAGYGWSDKDWTLIDNAGPGDSNQFGSVVTSHDADGGLGGFQIGYNHQFNGVVLGLESEFSWTGMDGYSTWLNEDDLFRDASTDIDWIITLAGRVGVTFDRTLVYAKGGVAWADESFSHTGGSDTNVRFFTGDNTATGWLIGAGLEYAMDQNWSIKAEYNYIDFGDERVSVTDGERTAIFDIDQDLQIAKIGINYRFDTGPRSEPLK
jgi:outer membrane immunogenic protein